MDKKMLLVAMSLPTLLFGETLALFNGKNLEGWDLVSVSNAVKVGEVWSVQDGILKCKGRPPGYIRTTREFSNYELNLEWRWPQKEKLGNSGILIHTKQAKEIFIWPKSIEIQLAHDHAGDFWEIGETLKTTGPPSQGRRWPRLAGSFEKQAGEWNHIRVLAKGSNVSIWINGTLANEAMQSSTQQGAICLQSEEYEVEFRKIQLTTLE